MSYNLQSTNSSPRDSPAPAPATGLPKPSAQGANLHRNNNSLGNNAAEGGANNLNAFVTISIADL